jgi:hypothetical protein
MEKRHENQLMIKLDELWLKNATFISYQEIYYWFNIDSIRYKPFKVIKERWIELLAENGRKAKYEDYPIQVFNNNVMGGFMLFVLHKEMVGLDSFLEKYEK